MAEWVRAEGGREREGGREGGREGVSAGGIERERKGAWEQGRGETRREVVYSQTGPCP